ncbi:MAG: MFS transporter, partial [Chloroflexi bacterium]
MGVSRMLRPAKPRRAAARAESRGRARPRGSGVGEGERAGLIRLQKVLADRGVASRRAAEELMREGRVRVGGEVIREMGTRVAPDARIEVDGHPVAPPVPHRYVLLNKPRG